MRELYNRRSEVKAELLSQRARLLHQLQEIDGVLLGIQEAEELEQGRPLKTSLEMEELLSYGDGANYPVILFPQRSPSI